jgi:radical SAM enzyme (TIGR01210 family)
VDPFVAQGSLIEQEWRPGGVVERTLTVFLTGAECPFTCSFCDLWKYTIDGPTVPGALTAQLEKALDGVSAERLKLYNASNFFDTRAVPRQDLAAIAKLAAPVRSVTVESHASLIGERAVEFARDIPGRLEVAVGLETIHPVAASRLNKKLDLARFDSAAEFLASNDIDLRVFVLLGAPHVPVNESIDWTVRTVEYAIDRGAFVVSIIPVRGGNGELERLEGLGEFIPPTLAQLEDAFDRCADFSGAAVTADLWDIERIADCDACREQRIARLELQNQSGVVEQRISCSMCDA